MEMRISIVKRKKNEVSCAFVECMSVKAMLREAGSEAREPALEAPDWVIVKGWLGQS